MQSCVETTDANEDEVRVRVGKTFEEGTDVVFSWH